MQDVFSPEVMVVTDKAAAQVLLDADARRWLAPFLAQASSVGAAAEALGEKPNSVLYRVNRWSELGLLRVEYQELRRGRQVKFYRSVADTFFVPHSASSTDGLVELLQTVNAPYLEALYRSVVSSGHSLSPTWGVQFSWTGTEIMIEAATAPGRVFDPTGSESPAVLEQFIQLQLDFKDAKAFQAELLGLLDRYKKKEGAQTYLGYLALAPLAHSRTKGD